MFSTGCRHAHLVLTLEVFEEGLVEVGGDAVEQRPKHTLGELVVVQVFHLNKRAGDTSTVLPNVKSWYNKRRALEALPTFGNTVSYAIQEELL